MGCGSSKKETKALSPRSPKKEIIDRVISSEVSKEIDLKSVKLKYAYFSQRGYYPDDLFKENQDSFVAIPEFGSTERAFFGVFDGHGKYGHLCAKFVSDIVIIYNIHLFIKYYI